MEKYWALDYVDELECELIVDCQLYATKEEAYAARRKLPHPERYEVTWYTLKDLKDEVFNGEEISISSDLVIDIW